MKLLSAIVIIIIIIVAFPYETTATKKACTK
jgi:hypothetical protein